MADGFKPRDQRSVKRFGPSAISDQPSATEDRANSIKLLSRRAPEPPKTREQRLPGSPAAGRRRTGVMLVFGLPRRTVLIVDDNQHIRALLSSALTSWGYPVATAGNGVEALDY